VTGDKSELKAETLASNIKRIIGEREKVNVYCPSRMLKIKLIGLPMAVKKEDIADAIAAIGDCEPGRIRVGPIKALPYGVVVMG